MKKEIKILYARLQSQKSYLSETKQSSTDRIHQKETGRLPKPQLNDNSALH